MEEEKTIVITCNSTDCVNNEKNQCMQTIVTILSKGKCLYYINDPSRLPYEPVYAGKRKNSKTNQNHQ